MFPFLFHFPLFFCFASQVFFPSEPEHSEPAVQQSKRTWGDTPSATGAAEAADFPSQDFPSLGEAVTHKQKGGQRGGGNRRQQQSYSAGGKGDVGALPRGPSGRGGEDELREQFTF